MSRRTCSDDDIIRPDKLIMNVELGSAEGLNDSTGNSVLRGVSRMEHVVEKGHKWSYFPINVSSTYTPYWKFGTNYDRFPITLNFWVNMQPKQVNQNGFCMGYLNNLGEIYADDFLNTTVSGGNEIGIQAPSKPIYRHPTIDNPTMVSVVFEKKYKLLPNGVEVLSSTTGNLFYNGELQTSYSLSSQPAANVNIIYGFILGVGDFPRPHRFRNIKLYNTCLKETELYSLYESEK